MVAIGLASIAAVAIQPVVFGAWFFLPAVISGADISPRDVWSLSMYVVLYASGFVLVLGIPLFLLLNHFNRANWRNLSLVGFGAAAIPFAVYSWAAHSSGFSSGGNWHGSYVRFVENGVPTIYGWLSYAEGVLSFGLHGFVGALVFLFVWRTFGRPNNRLQPTQKPSGPLRG